jgi:RHS repeat-associated protein
LKWKEQDLYGSSRLGMAKPEREVTGFFWASATYTLVAGAKSYELSNHLGNVMAVISDRGELQSAQDYFPFGMAMPGRSTDAKHRYGFNGKETDPETGIQDYGMRWYLPNIARFPSVDPITKKYPELTPYQFASNTPIMAIDLDGLEHLIITDQVTGKAHVRVLLETEGGRTPSKANRIIEVPTYRAILLDVITGTKTYFNVTRDAYMYRGVTTKNGTTSEGFANQPFEPASNKTEIYGTAKQEPYPHDNDMGLVGYRLVRIPCIGIRTRISTGCNELDAVPFEKDQMTNMQGESLKSTSMRSIENSANAVNVMFHIGSYYIKKSDPKAKHSRRFGGSAGCFAFIPADAAGKPKDGSPDNPANQQYTDLTSLIDQLAAARGWSSSEFEHTNLTISVVPRQSWTTSVEIVTKSKDKSKVGTRQNEKTKSRNKPSRSN